MEYCGEVVSLARFRERTAKYAAKGMRHFYFMTLEADTVRSLRRTDLLRGIPRASR